MEIDSNKLDEILKRVERPSRYAGNEWNSVRKSKRAVNIALSYPDVYDIGMSNLGLQILYEIINGKKDLVAERVFAPWPDMESELRAEGVPLFSLETRRPIKDFDFLGITLQYEMVYTNILNILELSLIPIFSTERKEDDPIVVGGGPCVFNPAPVSSFFDIILIGEGEEAIIEILNEYKKSKAKGLSRAEIIGALSGIAGVYAPIIHDVEISRNDLRIKKRVIEKLDSFKPPLSPVVPYLEAVHDRCMVEIMRGCTRGCRFCQAGMVYRPTRERSKANSLKSAGEILERTGYNEVSLVSLSSSDHSQIGEIIGSLRKKMRNAHTRVSVPSLRTDQFSVELAKELSGRKKSGLTFAPEAGTERLRKVINKGITEDDLLETFTTAILSGWRRVKLYFMIGLPSETDEDVIGIVDTAYKLIDVAKEKLSKSDFSRLVIVVNVSTFVPKAHTPFQWLPMIEESEIERRQNILKARLLDRRIKLKWHDSKTSIVEAAMARGGNELGRVIYDAWTMGCRFDGWDEFFNWEKWVSAFQKNGIELKKMASMGFAHDDKLPWRSIDTGIDDDWLLDEYNRSKEFEETHDCRFEACSNCGVCTNLSVDLDIAQARK